MSAIKQFFRRVQKVVTNRNKDLNLNANLLKFQASYSIKATLPRETVFHPEVLIPCFNHGRYLEASLKSIPSGVAVTVINDASTDDTLEIAYKLKENLSFKLISNEQNLNQGGSLNKAITESPNNLFIILNADDLLLKYCVPTLLSLFTAIPDIRMAGGSCIPFSAEATARLACVFTDTLGYDPVPRIYGPGDAKNFKKLNDINLTMSSCAFLRSAWEAVDGFWEFDRRICSFDDRDFQMRICSLFEVAVIEEPLALYQTTSSLGRAQSL